MYDTALSEIYGTCLGNQAGYQFSNNRITIQSSHVLDNRSMKPHRHIRGQLLYLALGSIVVLVENRFYVVYSGNYIWIPPGMEHKTFSRARSEVHSLYIDKEVGKSFSPIPFISKASPLFVQLLDRLTYLTHFTDGEDAMINSLESLLLMEIDGGNIIDVGLPLPKDKRLLSLCKRLFDDPLYNMTIEDLLKNIPISYRHAIRLFKQQTGIDFGKWRVLLRLHVAVSLLMSGYSVTRVSNEIGYSNPSGFSAAFKNEFGMSPREFVNNRNFDINKLFKGRFPQFVQTPAI